MLFPNQLPYYIDGDVKLTQSVSILRYLARKHQLYGQTDEEKVRIDVAEQQLVDLRNNLSRVAYSANCEELKPNFLETLPDQLSLLSKFLGDRPFVAGETLSYVDFLLFEYLVLIQTLVPGSLTAYNNFNGFIDRIKALPRVSAYMAQQPPRLFNSPLSKWNGSY